MASSPSFSVILVLKRRKFPDKNISLGEMEMVDLFKIPTPMSLDSLLSVFKSSGDEYIYIFGNDDLADFVSKSLVVNPAVATKLANGYGAHPKQSMVAEPVENTAMGNFFGMFSRGAKMVPTHSDSSRESILKAVGGCQVSPNKNEPLSERLFSFIKKPIYDNKSIDKGDIDVADFLGKRNKHTYSKNSASKAAGILLSPRAFSVARAKNLQQTRNKITVGNLGIMFLLYIIASIWSAEARSYPVSGRQSANISSFDDARRLHCWSFVPTFAPTSPAPISDNKKEKEKSKDNALYIQCWLLTLAPAPMSLAPSNDIDDKKVEEKLEYDAMHVKCQPFSPRLLPTSPALINGKEKSKHAMYLKCWLLVPTPAPSSAANMNDNKKDNPMLLFICGYPCCGFNIHNRCGRCCLKGVLHPPSATTHAKEARNGSGDGHGGGQN